MVPAVAVKDAAAAPAPTVTEAGTLSNPLLLNSETIAPPDGAALERVTVQTVPAPVARLDGEQESELTTGRAVTDTDVACEIPLYVAVIVRATLLLTLPAVAAKVALVAPAPIVTEPGTGRAALLLE